MRAKVRKVVFFDRDGVANVPPPDERRYVLAPEQLEIYPAFIDALRVVTDRGYDAVLVTNQKCVGRGLITSAELDAIHAKLTSTLAEHQLSLLDVYYCPATDDAHPDRKPNPGMLLRAAETHGIDLAQSWMIGDNHSDLVAGERAGCRTIKVGPPDPAKVPTGTFAGFWVKTIDDLPALLDRVVP